MGNKKKLVVISHAQVQKSLRYRWEYFAKIYKDWEVHLIVPRYWESYWFKEVNVFYENKISTINKDIKMLRKIKRVTNVISQPKLLKQLLSMETSGYLCEIGWIKAFKKQLPIDKDGLPLPWVTYSFIDFISDRLNKTMDIFEYGSGNSTLWYAEKTNSVTSVENDKQWFEKIKNSMPNNVQIYYEELIYGGKYSKISENLEMKFDIIIVDGRDRVNCMISAINSIKDGGIIVLDDSERESYQDGVEFLMKDGFKKIDFWGISPGLFYKKCTSVFYKNENCLGI